MCVVNSFKSLVHFGVSNSSRVSLFFSTNTQKAHTGFSGSTLSETTLHWRPTLKSLSSFNFLHTLLNASTICGGGHLTSSTPAPQHIGSLGHPPMAFSAPFKISTISVASGEFFDQSESRGRAGAVVVPWCTFHTGSPVSRGLLNHWRARSPFHEVTSQRRTASRSA
jgi:hypothetical protein